MTKQTLKNGLALLLQCFPHKDISFDVAWELLRDLEDRRFLVAVKDICSVTVDLYPNTNVIALIREIVLSGKDLLAGEAWEEVMAQISRVGHCGSPEFSDPVTDKAVRAIGWRNLCLSEHIGVERAHFLKIYETMAAREKKDRIRLPEVKKLLDQVVEKKEIGYEKMR